MKYFIFGIILALAFLVLLFNFFFLDKTIENVENAPIKKEVYDPNDPRNNVPAARYK